MSFTDKDGRSTKAFQKGKAWHCRCKPIAERICEQKLELSQIRSLWENW